MGRSPDRYTGFVKTSSPKVLEFYNRAQKRDARGRWTKYYHGSNESFKPGDIIRPASSVGKKGNQPDEAWATKDFRVAVAFGTKGGSTPARVYEVEPVDSNDVKVVSALPERDGSKDYTFHRYAASKSGFRVIREIPQSDIKLTGRRSVETDKRTKSRERQKALAQKRKNRQSQIWVDSDPKRKAAFDDLAKALNALG